MAEQGTAAGPWSHDYGLPTSSGLRSHDINLSQSQDKLRMVNTISGVIPKHTFNIQVVII